MSSVRQHQGFTLIEMLIAIALTAVVAAMAYQSLDSASRSAERTREVLGDINKLDKAWQLIAQDMRGIVPIEAVLGAETRLPGMELPKGLQGFKAQNTQTQTPVRKTRFEAASLSSKGKDAFQVLMVFSRRGWFNPLERLRSDLQVVNYRLSAGKLWRDYMPERNMPQDNVDFERESLHQLLLEGVVDVQLRFLSEGNTRSNGKSVLEGSDYSKAWDTTWPPMGQSGAVAMPIAVEITIDVENVGRSTRLFELPQPVQSQGAPGPSGGQAQSSKSASASTSSSPSNNN